MSWHESEMERLQLEAEELLSRFHYQFFNGDKELAETLRQKYLKTVKELEEFTGESYLFLEMADCDGED